MLGTGGRRGRCRRSGVGCSPTGAAAWRSRSPASCSGVALFTGCLLTTLTASRGFEEFAAGDQRRGRRDRHRARRRAPHRSPPRSAASSTSRWSDRLAELPGVSGGRPAPRRAHGVRGTRAAPPSSAINFRVAAALVGHGPRARRRALPAGARGGSAVPAPTPTRSRCRGDVARDLGATIGDAGARERARRPAVPFTTVGMLEPSGLGGLDRIGFTTLPTVQRLVRATGRGHPGGDRARRRRGHGRLGRRARGGRPRRRRAHRAPPTRCASSASSSTRSNGALTVLGGGLLLTAGFLIYLTLSMSVAERTRLYGTLRSLGRHPPAGASGRVRARRSPSVPSARSLGLVLGLGVAARAPGGHRAGS